MYFYLSCRIKRMGVGFQRWVWQKKNLKITDRLHLALNLSCDRFFSIHWRIFLQRIWPETGVTICAETQNRHWECHFVLEEISSSFFQPCSSHTALNCNKGFTVQRSCTGIFTLSWAVAILVSCILPHQCNITLCMWCPYAFYDYS